MLLLLTFCRFAACSLQLFWLLSSTTIISEGYATAAYSLPLARSNCSGFYRQQQLSLKAMLLLLTLCRLLAPTVLASIVNSNYL